MSSASSGGSCRSPSMTMAASPVAKSIPAVAATFERRVPPRERRARDPVAEDDEPDRSPADPRLEFAFVHDVELAPRPGSEPRGCYGSELVRVVGQRPRMRPDQVAGPRAEH